MPPRDDRGAGIGQAGGQDAGVVDGRLLIGAELLAHRLAEGDRLGGDDVHERTALDAGEDALVDRLGVLLARQDHAAARAAQGLVGRGGHDVASAGPATGWTPAATRPAKCAMSVISSAPTSSAISRKAAKSQSRGYAVAPGHDHLRPMLARQRAHLVHVDQVGLAVDVVRDEVVVLAGEVDRRAVGQVAALVEPEAEHGVAALQQRVEDGHVGLRAGVGLDVGVLGAEQLLRAIAREVLRHVDDLAAAVVAPPGIALGVLARSGPIPSPGARPGSGSSPTRSARGASCVRASSSRMTCADLRILGLERCPEVHGGSLVGIAGQSSSIAIAVADPRRTDSAA